MVVVPFGAWVMPFPGIGISANRESANRVPIFHRIRKNLGKASLKTHFSQQMFSAWHCGVLSHCGKIKRAFCDASRACVRVRVAGERARACVDVACVRPWHAWMSRGRNACGRGCRVGATCVGVGVACGRAAGGGGVAWADGRVYARSLDACTLRRRIGNLPPIRRPGAAPTRRIACDGWRDAGRGSQTGRQDSGPAPPGLWGKRIPIRPRP